jgi:hypothetical protein
VSLTGDKRMDALVDPAAVIVRAVREDRAMHIDAMLSDAESVYGSALDGARAMVVLLAAMVRDDHQPERLLQWRRNPVEYRRLRALGVDSDTAGSMAAAIADRMEQGAA